MSYTVYKHTAPNGKVYIGITSKNVKKRWDNGNGYAKNAHFYSAIQKYGWENFEHQILFCNLSKDEACQKEIELIAKHNSNNRKYGYNISSGGESGAAGTHRPCPEKVKLKIGELYRGKHLSEEHRKKLSEAHKGKKLSDEHIRKLREAHKGKRISEEAKRKIGEANRLNSAKCVRCVESGKKYSSIKEACKETGVYYSSIGKCCAGKQRTAGGYRWEYC